ncbi:LPXTG cell wall anchor domain-containing protein [Staphylococcus haemolyticus]|nr:LPXTG cell wall anchor domain-containing protein [Staphylococcus haemolyticus]
MSTSDSASTSASNVTSNETSNSASTGESTNSSNVAQQSNHKDNSDENKELPETGNSNDANNTNVLIGAVLSLLAGLGLMKRSRKKKEDKK